MKNSIYKKKKKLLKYVIAMVILLMGTMSYMYLEITTFEKYKIQSKEMSDQEVHMLLSLQNDITGDVDSKTMPEFLGELIWNDLQDLIELEETPIKVKNKEFKTYMLIIWSNFLLYLMLRYYWLQETFNDFNSIIDNKIIDAQEDESLKGESLRTHQKSLLDKKLYVTSSTYFKFWKWRSIHFLHHSKF